MCKILLSINPEHVNNIFLGTKKYEFRKVNCKKKVDRIIVYSTFPVKKVIGEVEVISTIVKTPEEIWEETKNESGITKQFFDKYYCNRDKAIAFKLGSIHLYDNPKELSEYGIKTAPQSFVYL